jgi:hypothetical protein
MSGGGREVDRAVSRTLRETLNTLQRTGEELNQALNDLVAACGSTRPTNALPPILRAQTAAASLEASLAVLSRFVTNSSQPGLLTGEPIEEEDASTGAASSSPSAVERPSKSPAASGRVEAPSATEAPSLDARPQMSEPPSSPVQEPFVRDFSTAAGGGRIDSRAAQTSGQGRASELAGHQAANPIEELPAAAASFDISTLQPEEQDLHRRANRVAKVSMQDIKMLRPDEVRLGREHKDICVRLRDDIEKAHKEYDRRFQSILVHPVDYFYDWMVEILGEGDPAALGEYPYPSPAVRR